MVLWVRNPGRVRHPLGDSDGWGLEGRDRPQGPALPRLSDAAACQLVAGWDTYGLTLWAGMGFQTAWVLTGSDPREQGRHTWHCYDLACHIVSLPP